MTDQNRLASIAPAEYVKTAVAATELGLNVNPTPFTVRMAFVLNKIDPVDADWRVADWVTETTASGSVYWARCLVGSAATGALAKGTYSVWVSVDSPPEMVVVLATQKLVVF